MNKKLYLLLCLLFASIFIIGVNLLKIQTKADITLMSYYTGGHNTAIDYFNDNTEYNMQFIGSARDSYTTKVDSLLYSDEMPDILIIPSSDLGRYLDTGLFYDFNTLFKDNEGYQYYLDNTNLYSLDYGNINDQQLAIKFENNSSVFVYNQELASYCLSINSVDEMNRYLTDYQKLRDMQNILDESSDNKCNKMSVLATQEYTNYLSDVNNIIVDGEINDDIIDYFNFIKDANTSKLVYSRYGTYDQLIDDANEGLFLGEITTVNKLRSIYDFSMDNTFAIGNSPILYNGEIPYFLISKDANLDLVYQFFDMTYFNEDWLIDNINDLGVVDNSEIMNNSQFDTINLEEYFINDNLYDDIDGYTKRDKTSNVDVSTYDYGIRNSVSGVLGEYENNTIFENEIIENIKQDIEIFYN